MLKRHKGNLGVPLIQAAAWKMPPAIPKELLPAAPKTANGEKLEIARAKVAKIIENDRKKPEKFNEKLHELCIILLEVYRPKKIPGQERELKLYPDEPRTIRIIEGRRRGAPIRIELHKPNSGGNIVLYAIRDLAKTCPINKLPAEAVEGIPAGIDRLLSESYRAEFVLRAGKIRARLG